MGLDKLHALGPACMSCPVSAAASRGPHRGHKAEQAGTVRMGGEAAAPAYQQLAGVPAHAALLLRLLRAALRFGGVASGRAARLGCGGWGWGQNAAIHGVAEVLEGDANTCQEDALARAPLLAASMLLELGR